jgi:alcohol dehydrogenase (cytochrome c)
MYRLSTLRCALILIALLATGGGVFAAVEVGLEAPAYTADQSLRGAIVYGKRCAVCHGPSLNDGEFAPPLKGERFLLRWGGRKASELFNYTLTKMPSTAPRSLSPGEVGDVLAHMLRENGVAPSLLALPIDDASLQNMGLPASTIGLPTTAGGITSGVVLPASPEPLARPLDRYTDVTDAMLRNPPDQDWLTWRRTPDVQGHSPLRQINTSNVRRLGVKWSWALPNGPNEATPLVHDGVLFVFGFGDVVQALNAETGDLLWEYAPTLPRDVLPSYRKSIALYGDKVLTTTSNMHVVALDAKTGDVLWDVPIVDATKGYSLTGGPLVAMGNVIVGTGGRVPGGNFIVALDVQSGKEVWRFATVQQPGSAHDSWNGLPLAERSGGAVWTPGSFDPQSGLVFFGPSPTYDTLPLSTPLAGPGSNDALYTNSTVALDPRTGALVWNFQHVPNDQWDMDWAFERMIIDLPDKSRSDRVVVTVGKPAIIEAVDVKTGQYRFSIDLGLQDLVAAIDPTTGAKTIDRQRTPGNVAQRICPHSNGAKNWLPNAYNAKARILFIPLNESCMDMVPIDSGGSSLLSTKVAMTLRPRAGSDGRYGRLEAVDLVSRKSVWTNRRRALRVC